MIKIKSFDTLGECDRTKCLLEASGIHCEIRNEYGATSAGFGADLWIVDDEKKGDAMDILSGKGTKEK